MKIRTGFVSNSSSSSYTCDVTGHTESGWDYGLKECGMAGCENHHVFLQKFLPKPINEIVEEVIEEWQEEDRKEGKSEEEIQNTDWESAFYANEGLDYLPAEYCPICTFRNVPDYVRSSYLRYKAGMTEKELDEEIREKFGNLDVFREEMKNVGIWEK